MIEAIILSTLFFTLGGLVGAFTVLGQAARRVKHIKLNNGNYLYMWKGFVDPNKVFVTVDTAIKNDIQFGNDLVVFDNDGHIIYVEKHDKA